MVWLMLVAAVRAMRNENYDFTRIVLYIGGAVLALLLISLLVDLFRDREEKREATADGALAPPDRFDPMAGGYPVPPLPGQQAPVVPRRPSRARRQLVGAPGAPGASGVSDPNAAQTEKTKEDGDA